MRDLTFTINPDDPLEILVARGRGNSHYFDYKLVPQCALRDVDTKRELAGIVAALQRAAAEAA